MTEAPLERCQCGDFGPLEESHYHHLEDSSSGHGGDKNENTRLQLYSSSSAGSDERHQGGLPTAAGGSVFKPLWEVTRVGVATGHQKRRNT
ncbi:hypothetical protein EYF80_010977 [Liparis tanakae]|uniref:Uncharacterized protein n=1 Tax=Liparis tanakae TaxID=230148 RepID=A0A4Z2IM16_9TELE|nr:hypothetical protein EYF80_010977 [Liparis tanakae]